MRSNHRSQRSFSESFFLVFIWLYFLFHHSPLCALKYHFTDSTRTVLANGFMNRNVELCAMNSQIQRSFSERSFLIFIWGYFLWQYSLQSNPKYQFSDSTKTCLANGSMKYRCNSVSWIDTSQSILPENFLLFLSWGYLWSQSATVCLIADSAKTLVAGFWMKTMM